MDAWEESRRVLLACGLGSDLTYEKTIHSSVTDAWGVQWDEREISRDLLQNFYDANKDDPASITVTVESALSRVTITAPTPFQLERLFYLGSEKGDEDVGQYGEGFKAAALCLLRDHGVHPIGVSGDRAVFLRFAAAPVAGTQLRPIEYDFFTSPRPLCAGSALILHGCKQQKLVAALEAGITQFFCQRPTTEAVGLPLALRR